MGGPEFKIMHFASTDNCMWKRETEHLSEELGVRLRHKCRGGRIVHEQDMDRALRWGADVVYTWWVKVDSKALEHARSASVDVVEFAKTRPGAGRENRGLENSPIMRFFRDLRHRARAKVGFVSREWRSR